jgi:hypothetical protein
MSVVDAPTPGAQAGAGAGTTLDITAIWRLVIDELSASAPSESRLSQHHSSSWIIAT